tara:strand:+ start:1364 stop:1567 length:204 start_codon:yes stop_codon:yes gene_type:complete
MAELLESLVNKNYTEQKNALEMMSKTGKEEIGFIDIDGAEYLIPKKVLQLIDMLYTENEKLKSEDGL